MGKAQGSRVVNGRDTILGRIRKQVGSSADQTARRATVANRMGAANSGIIPKRGQLPHGERVDLFCAQAEAVQASVVRVAGRPRIATAVADYLRGHNLPMALRHGDDPRLQNGGWASEPLLERRTGPAVEADIVGLSYAASGVAETGTLVLTSGGDNPTTINFLPENHIVVVDAADIRGDYEAALEAVRASLPAGEMPRTINMITGPSRSGDIEQTILLGAHGPRNLHIIVVEGNDE